MPQISKIRIVNFTYNDGNRFIPDELYDLSSAETNEALNSLFNLNNGGGKTVLVQLIMQPVHPKAEAGGRRIEGYFLRPGDHSFVILEWILDGSRDKLLTGIAMAASSGDNQRGNQIKYYTFMTTYDGHSPYSISSLELSKNENGKYVPAPFEFVRDAAKKSRGDMRYYSSDDSVKWTEALSEYGIHRTEWKTVIEELNKDEGGLNQYFSDAKTSDKLIAKFFIPAIEHKLTDGVSKGTDISLETMLINYAKRITDKENVICERNTNNKLLYELSFIYDMIGWLYSVNDELASKISEAFGFKAALLQRITAIESEIVESEREIEIQNNIIDHINYEERSKTYYDAEERYERAKKDFEETDKLLEKCEFRISGKKHEEAVISCAELYKQIQESEGNIKAFKKLIEDKENNSDDAQRIADLKYSVFVKANEIKKNQENIISALQEKIKNENDSLCMFESKMKIYEREFNEAKKNYNAAESNLAAAKKLTDRRIETLKIEALRKLDGFYSKEEIYYEKICRLNAKKAFEEEALQTEKLINEINIRLNEIPGEKIQKQTEEKETAESIRIAASEMNEYDSKYKMLVKVCCKYNLDNTAVFSDLLRSTVQKEIEDTKAAVSKSKHDMRIVEEKKKSAEKGTLHIIPEVMRYVKSTGISCRTGEEYICGLIQGGKLPNETAERIISDYPELAYSLLFDNADNVRKILTAGNIDWLPAAVPLLTMEQVGSIFDGSLEAHSFLAVCDRAYFSDKNGYINKKSNELSELHDRIEYLEEHMREGKEEQSIADSFNYAENWRTEQEKHINSLRQMIEELNIQLRKLDKESQLLKKDISDQNKKLKDSNRNIQKIELWFESFSELEDMISDEDKCYKDYKNDYSRMVEAEEKYNSAHDNFQRCSGELSSLRSKLEDNNEILERIYSVIAEVDNAKKAEVIDDNFDRIYSQYTTLLRNINEDLKKLKSDLERENNNKRRKQKELEVYDCEKGEYENKDFSPDSLPKVRKELKKLDAERSSIQSDYNIKNGEYNSAKESCRNARNSLSDHGGVPLERCEIGDSFKSRIKDARNNINALSVKNRSLGEEKLSYEKIRYQTEELLNEFNVEEISVSAALSDDVSRQWKELKNSLKLLRKKYGEQKSLLNEKLRSTMEDYKAVAVAQIIEKLEYVRGMLEDSEIKGDKLYTISESISAMIESIEKINSKIETDLREIDNDFNDIVNQCFMQGKRMYTDLRMIAASSKAHIYDGKPQTQMVKIELPAEKEISEEASRTSVKVEIEQGANEIKELIKGGAEYKQILKRAKIIVGSERLLYKYIRKDTVPIKVYKIDFNSANSSYKLWEDTLTQSSGAEKFVAFFSIVLTLMNYTRSSSGIVSKNAKSVLILDNPFGKITSAHLLKPVFDIAKHFNVQLICLSDINKSDVISCFDCVIKLLIKTQNLSNIEVLTHDNNEKIEHGYYKITNGQLSLF